MEQNANNLRGAATDAPEFSIQIDPPDSGSPTQPPIDHPVAAERPASGRKPRHDGWTPQRIRDFLTVLASCGMVSEAARAARISASSAYRFRRRASGRFFALAWEAALWIARRLIVAELASGASDERTE